MLGTPREALIDPDGFFEDRTDPRLLLAATVVTSYALLKIVAEYLLSLVPFRKYSPGVLLLGFLSFAVPRSILWFGSWLLFSALYIWCCYIWVFALKHARGLSTREAIITIVVPVVFFSSVSLLV